MKPRRREDSSQLQWTVEVVATTVFWGLWAYFITPVLSIVLWYLGYEVFVEEMFELGGFEALRQKLRDYGLVILTMAVVTVAWVFYNRLRYGGSHNTRTHMLAPVSRAQTAQVAGLRAERISSLQAAKRVVASFDDSDRLRPRVARGGPTSTKRRKRRVSLRRAGRKE